MTEPRMPRVSEMTETVFDGVSYPYVPPKALRISPRLKRGNRIAGPAVVETTDTTIVVYPGRKLGVDAFGNFEMEFSKQEPPCQG